MCTALRAWVGDPTFLSLAHMWISPDGSALASFRGGLHTQKEGVLWLGCCFESELIKLCFTDHLLSDYRRLTASMTTMGD